MKQSLTNHNWEQVRNNLLKAAPICKCGQLATVISSEMNAFGERIQRTMCNECKRKMVKYGYLEANDCNSRN